MWAESTTNGPVLSGAGSQPAAIRRRSQPVRMHLAESGLDKSGRQPLRANLFPEGRRGNGHKLRLPVHDFARVSMQPAKAEWTGRSAASAVTREKAELRGKKDMRMVSG